MWLSTLIFYPWANSITLTQLYPPYLAQILGLWVTCGVKMMWLCHGWGWQSPQTASHIHIRHAQSIWAHLYTVHWHMVAALHRFTHPTRSQFLGSGTLAESKSILDMYNVFEHIDMLSMGIQYHPYSFIPTLLLGLDFGVLGLMWCQHDVNGWGWQSPQTASHIHIRHIQSVWAHW